MPEIAGIAEPLPPWQINPVNEIATSTLPSRPAPTPAAGEAAPVAPGRFGSGKIP